MNPHRVPFNEITPLTKVDYTKIYNDLSTKLSPDEMVFAKWRAGFGGMIQWDMPADLNWVPVNSVNSFERNEAMALLRNVRASASGKLGSNVALIDAVYSIPDPSFMYVARDAGGRLRIMLCGWGYRYPKVSAINPLSWSPDGEQPVRMKFVENGNEAIVTVNLNHASGYSKSLPTDDAGELDLGNHRPGSRFSFTVQGRDHVYTLDVVEGKSVYLYDLTVAQPDIPVPPQIVDTPAPEPVEDIVVGDVRINLFEGENKPVTPARVRVRSGDRTLFEGSVDKDGSVKIQLSEFGGVSVFDVELSRGSKRWPTVSVGYDPTETLYEIHYNEQQRSQGSGWWLIAIGVAATVVAFLALGSADVMELDIF